MQKIQISNILAQRELLMKNSEDFNVILTNSVKKIECNGVQYFNVLSEFTNIELNFIKKVRREIIERCKAYELKHGKIETLKCNYVNWSIELPFSCSKVWEVDMNSAYWTFAEHLGYISPETYKIGLEQRKKVRLAALGSVAKGEKVIQYKKGEYFDSYVIRNEYAKAFYNVSRYIYDIMAICKAALGEDYLFFWTDAIFFKYSKKGAEIDNLKLVKDIILEAGLESKEYFISDFKFNKTDKQIIVKSEGHKRYSRTFNLSKSNGW